MGWRTVLTSAEVDTPTRGLVLSHTLECRLIIHTFLETLTHTLTRNTNYAWNDLGDLDGTPKVTDIFRQLIEMY